MADESILHYVAKYISVNMATDEVSLEVAKPQLIRYIDDSIGDLVQNGVGKPISLDDNPNATWDDFFGLENRNRMHAKTYICANTIALYDPGVANIDKVLEKLRDKSLYRARIEVEYGK
jgi:hypothetical protein